MGLFPTRRRGAPANPGYGAEEGYPPPARLRYANSMGMEGPLPTLFAPDPGGLLARRPSVEFLVESPQTAVQHSPKAYWYQGTPYPGPPATVTIPVDLDSARWWGRTGQGQLVWSSEGEISADLPPPIPQDMAQHIDTFQRFWGGFPSFARNRPAAFGDVVPVFNPVYPDW